MPDDFLSFSQMPSLPGKEGVCQRSAHVCASPKTLAGVPATPQPLASFALYLFRDWEQADVIMEV